MARQWHEEWKERLLGAVNAQQPIDTSVIAEDDCCDLGQWLYTDGRAIYGQLPAFRSLVLQHKEFHLLAGAVAEVINKKQYALAQSYLTNDTLFALSSDEVGRAIQRLERALSAS
ncbi:MAG: CZB domain-containing protein [Rhodoferax sp.]|nr:CZB domain-containing protein [Rhodoferax sp.]